VVPAIVTVPEREAVPVLAAVLRLTVPLPEPEAPAVTVIHETLLTAVHAQPVGAATLTEPVPPAAVIVAEVGVMVSVQGAAASVTVKVAPAMVKVPVRAVPAGLAAALKPTDPLPLPVAPLVMVTQLSLLAAVQAHPVGAVTETEPVPPPATTDCEVGVRL
jgi:hypothetical protein